MVTNIIMFAQPAAKIVNVLPVYRRKLSVIIAVLFTGSVLPTMSEFKQTQSHVLKALTWLKFNHQDYVNVRLSDKNLTSYNEDDMPIGFFYQPLSAYLSVKLLSVVFDCPDNNSGDDCGSCLLFVCGTMESDLNSS
jgi:hypothetical protein